MTKAKKKKLAKAAVILAGVYLITKKPKVQSVKQGPQTGVDVSKDINRLDGDSGVNNLLNILESDNPEMWLGE